MEKKSNHQKESGATNCIAPNIGALIPEYIVALLAEDDVETVRNHLLACVPCRQRYLTVVRVREAAQEARRQAERKSSEPA